MGDEGISILRHHRSHIQWVERAGGRSGYLGPEEASSSALLHRRAADWGSDSSLKHSDASYSHPSGHPLWFANAGTCSTCEGQYWERTRWPKYPFVLWPCYESVHLYHRTLQKHKREKWGWNGNTQVGKAEYRLQLFTLQFLITIRRDC